jgi:hypothetical protein
MLSIKESSKEQGRKIARIKGGKDDGKYIYLKEEKSSNEDLDISSLSKDFFKKHKKIKKGDAVKLLQALREQNPPQDEDLRELYMEAIEDLRKQKRNEVRITGGKLQPLPNKDMVEKIYVSAPSGAGKSTWCGKWIAEFKKMFKDDEYYVFSTIKSDKVLDKHEPIRITLSKELLTDPISPEEIMESVCVFDDVDTITDPKIRQNICGLRDWLLEQGRHFNIRMLMTSHLLMNYSSTRRLLNESTAVVFFPKCGSTYHIKRFLKQYAGLDKGQIKRILNLPSRWVALYKTYPMYVMYEKGAYLLSNEDDEL